MHQWPRPITDDGGQLLAVMMTAANEAVTLLLTHRCGSRFRYRLCCQFHGNMTVCTG